VGDLNQPKVEAKAPVAARKFRPGMEDRRICCRCYDQVGKGRDFAARANSRLRNPAMRAVPSLWRSGRSRRSRPDRGGDPFSSARTYLESITEPSKVISEQFMSSLLTLTNGSVVVGRITSETETVVLVATNPFAATTTPGQQVRDQVPRTVKGVAHAPGPAQHLPPRGISSISWPSSESMGDAKHPDFQQYNRPPRPEPGRP